jgi:heat shock protein HslJ
MITQHCLPAAYQRNGFGSHGVWTGVKTKVSPLLLAVLLASCAYVTGGSGRPDLGPGSPSPDPSVAANPAGSWILTQGTGPSGQIPVLDDHPITLVIDAQKAGGHAACNIYGGTVTIDGDAMELSAMSMTEMACVDERAMNAEADYMSALAAVTRWARDGNQLIVTGEGVELTFELQPPVPDAEIIGTTWVLDTLIEGDAASTVPGEAILLLATDGSFSGSTGCRQLTGSYRISGDAIDLGEVIATGDCTDELRQQDALVLDVLDGGVKATVDGSTLTLLGDDRQGLGYHAAQRD